MELADEQDQRIMHLQKLSSSSSKVGILSSPTSEVLLGERRLTYRLFLPHHISGSSSQAEDFLGRYNQASLPGRRMKASLGACPPKWHSDTPPSAIQIQAWWTFLKKDLATKACLQPPQSNSPGFLHLGFPDLDDASPRTGAARLYQGTQPGGTWC